MHTDTFSPWLTPMQYFYYLRNQWGYTTRHAWLSTLMRFCSGDDLERRLARGRRTVPQKRYRAIFADGFRHAAAVRCFKGDRRDPLVSHDDEQLTIVVTGAGLDLLRLLPDGICTWGEC